MKKFITIAFILTMMICIFGTITSYAEIYENLTYDVVEGEAIITGLADSGGTDTIEIPDQIGIYPVTQIGEAAFAYSQIQSITIPESVKTIGVDAFFMCLNLANISVDSNNPNYSSLDGVLFDGNMTELLLFPTAKPDTTYSIPDTVTTIGDFAFERTMIQSITFPESVTTIKEDPFYMCVMLKSIVVDSKNPNYSSLDGVLYNGNMTELLLFPEANTTATYTIPDTVTTIGMYAFKDNSFLENIIIGRSVKDIDSKAFSSLYCLANFSISDDNQYYDVVDGILFNKSKTKIICCPMRKEKTTYTVPAGVTTIGAYAFYKCTNLVKISLCQGVTDIENSAFENCDIESIELPDSLKSIGEKAFYSCTELTSDGISLPSGINSIGEEAFWGCDSLTTITIPDSVTAIKSGMFNFCSSLTSVTIGKGVKSIDDGAFEYCGELTDITGLEGVESIGMYAFSACTKLEKITIPDSVKDIGWNVFEGCTNLKRVVLGKGMTYVPSSAFAWCTELVEVIFSDTVEEIQSNVFHGCTGLKNITLGEGVNLIWSGAFEGCINLESITLPKSIKTISNTCFNDCTNLTTVNYNGSEDEWSDIFISFDNEPLKNAARNYFWYVEYVDANGNILARDKVNHNTAAIPNPELGDASGDIFFSDKEFEFNFDFTKPITSNITVYVKGATASSALYRINSITIKDSSGASLTTIPKNSFRATVSITNINSTGNNTVILTQYSSEGKLEELMFIDVEDMPAGTTFKITVPIKNADGNVGKLKAMVWDSINFMKPLGNAVTFPEE